MQTICDDWTGFTAAIKEVFKFSTRSFEELGLIASKERPFGKMDTKTLHNDLAPLSVVQSITRRIECAFALRKWTQR